MKLPTALPPVDNGIGKSTVSDIKKNRSKLEQFKKKIVDKGVKKASIKAMRFENVYYYYM